MSFTPWIFPCTASPGYREFVAPPRSAPPLYALGSFGQAFCHSGLLWCKLILLSLWLSGTVCENGLLLRLGARYFKTRGFWKLRNLKKLWQTSFLRFMRVCSCEKCTFLYALGFLAFCRFTLANQLCLEGSCLRELAVLVKVHSLGARSSHLHPSGPLDCLHVCQNLTRLL